MSGCLRTSTLKMTLQTVRILGRSSMGDNMRSVALNLCLKRYPHAALTSVRLKSKATGRSDGKGNHGETYFLLKSICHHY